MTAYQIEASAGREMYFQQANHHEKVVRCDFGVFIGFIYGAGGDGVVLSAVRVPFRCTMWFSGSFGV